MLSATYMNTIYQNKKTLIDALIRSTDEVLDVGFSGQGVTAEDDVWPHRLLQHKAASVNGVDLFIDREQFSDTDRYQEASAESFSFPGKKFDVIFAGDLIEHLPNPGLFLASCKAHLRDDSRLIITTPNAFNLFNLTEKLTKEEPTVNSDHTMYFNQKTLRTLFAKCNFEIQEIAYVYTLGYKHKESLKKKFLNGLNKILSRITPKFSETLVIVARPVSSIPETV